MQKKTSKLMNVFTLEKLPTDDASKSICFTMKMRPIPQQDFLTQAYKIIGCRYVDVAEFEYKGKKYDVWFDDEFLYSNQPLCPTLFLGELRPNSFTVICGNFIIAHTNEEGETVGITSKEANELSSFMIENNHKMRKAFAMGLIGKKTA